MKPPRLDPIQTAIAASLLYTPSADLLINPVTHDSICLGSFSVAQLETAVLIRREQERVAAVVSSQVEASRNN